MIMSAEQIDHTVKALNLLEGVAASSENAA